MMYFLFLKGSGSPMGMVRQLMPMMGRGSLPPGPGGPPMSGPFPGVQQPAYGGPVMGPPGIQQPPQAAPPAAVKRGPPIMNPTVPIKKRVRYDHPQQPAANGYQQFQPSPVPMQPQPQPQYQPQIQPQQQKYYSLFYCI